MTDSFRQARQDSLQKALQGLSPDDRTTAKQLVSLLARFERLGGTMDASFSPLSEFYALGPRLQRTLLLAFERRIADPDSPAGNIRAARPLLRQATSPAERQHAGKRVPRPSARPQLVRSGAKRAERDAYLDAVAFRWAAALTELDVPGMVKLMAEDATLVDESAGVTMSGALSFIDYAATWTRPFEMTTVVAEVRRDGQTGTWLIIGDCHIHHLGLYDWHWGTSPPSGANFVLPFTHHCAISSRGITHLRIRYDPAVLRRGIGLQR